MMSNQDIGAMLRKLSKTPGIMFNPKTGKVVCDNTPKKAMKKPKKVYYILSNYTLTQVESKPSLEEYEEESHLEVDGRTEITYKKIGSDEGGNPEDSDDNESDDEDEWNDVYLYHGFGAFCGEHEHLQPYLDFYYYQCWGGGPEGGYITNGKETYRVNRTWGEPFTVERVNGRVEEKGNQIRIIKQ
jgi:hypothetical protein